MLLAALNGHGQLPTTRCSLLKKAADLLLHEWDLSKNLVQTSSMSPEIFSYQDKQIIAEQIAWSIQEPLLHKSILSDKVNLIHEDEIVRSC